MRDVDEQRIGIVYPMTLLKRVFLRRIMFNIDPRETALCVAQQIDAVLIPLGFMLEQDYIEFLRCDLYCRHFMHVRAPWQNTTGTSIPRRIPRFGKDRSRDAPGSGSRDSCGKPMRGRNREERTVSAAQVSGTKGPGVVAKPPL
jgi:hypothetical protein